MLILNFLKDFKVKALTAKIFLIINGLGGRQVLMFPNSNPNNINAGATAGFVKRSAVRSPAKLKEDG